ncbi:MAG: hypothetical protein STSR0009_27010 [Methanoregula sp.]
MKLPVWFSLKRLPLRVYLAIFIILIIVVVTLFLSYTSFVEERNELVMSNEMLRQYTEKNAIQSQVLVDTGLRLYDDTWNGKMQSCYPEWLAAYEQAGRDPRNMDLAAIQSQMFPVAGSTFDLYVINKSGVIIASTVPEVMYLDFGRDFPNYYAYLKKGLSEGSFFADRVVRSVVSTKSGKVTGELRKFAFMPTPDKEYLLELGLVSSEFEEERTQLTVVGAAETLKDLNPNLRQVRVFDANKVLLTESGQNTSFTPTPETSNALDRTLHNGEDIWINTTGSDLSTHYLLVNLTDAKTATDMNLVLELTYSDAFLRDRLNGILRFHLLIGLVAILLGVILSYAAAHHITRPITGIIDDADLIAQGDLDHPIRSMENPEFQKLRESITVMIQRIRDYSSEIEKEQAELQIAAEIQRDFLPDTLPVTEGFCIAARSIPAREVGGDFFDVIPMEGIPLSDPLTGIVIGDVSGKGVPAALFMALSRIVVRVTAQRDAVPADVIATANSVIATNSRTGMFVTLFYGILDHRTRTLTYVNAGHNPPLLFRTGSDIPEELPATGIALGAMEDACYRQETVALGTGDLVLLFTDGITEAINADVEMYGQERLLAVMNENRMRTPCEIMDAVIQSVVAFSGSQPQFDDITLLVVKVD